MFASSLITGAYKHLSALWSALVLLLVGGCSINPVTLDRELTLMSESEEIELGRQYHQQFLEQHDVYNDPRVQKYVNGVGQNIALLSHRNNLDYQITVIDSPELNAFALAGGYIYVTRGMMAYLNSEAELAAVLAHEVGHIAGRHAVRKDAVMKIPNFLGQVLFNHIGFGIDRSYNKFLQAKLQHFSQEFELEADRLAVEYLVRSGYSPTAMSRVISTIKGNEEQVKQLAAVSNPRASIYHGFNAHPDSSKRQQLVQQEIQTLGTEIPEGRSPVRLGYLEHVHGLVYGASQSGRVVKGKHLHAPSRSGLNVPAGWHVNSSGKILRMVSPGEEAVIQVLSKPHSPGTSAQTHLHRLLLSDELFDEVALERDDLQGWIARSTKQTADGEIPLWLATWIIDDVVRVMVATATSDEYAQSIIDTLRSFSRLSEAELQLTQPRRVDVLQAEAGMSYHQLGLDSPLKSNAEQQLRLINGQTDINEDLRAGQWIKVIR